MRAWVPRVAGIRTLVSGVAGMHKWARGAPDCCLAPNYVDVGLAACPSVSRLPQPHAPRLVAQASWLMPNVPCPLSLACQPTCAPYPCSLPCVAWPGLACPALSALPPAHAVRCHGWKMRRK
eukprot:jgi/Mesvir1/10036/Mv26082-RA.1